MITVTIYQEIDLEVWHDLEKKLHYFGCNISYIKDRNHTLKSNKVNVESIDDLFSRLIYIYEFVIFLEKNNFELVISKPPFELESSEFIELLKEFGAHEKEIMESQRKDIKRQRVKKPLGRPKISEGKVLEMQQLFEDKLTLREIALICDVSLGTVHKYTRECLEDPLN